MFLIIFENQQQFDFVAKASNSFWSSSFWRVLLIINRQIHEYIFLSWRSAYYLSPLTNFSFDDYFNIYLRVASFNFFELTFIKQQSQLLIFIIPYQQIKQKLDMYNKQFNNVKKNQRNIEEFYNLKRTLRHSSHKKTYHVNRTYNPDMDRDQYQKIAEEKGSIFNQPFNYTIDLHTYKANADSLDLKIKKNVGSTQQIYQIKKNAYKNYVREIYQKINDELRKKNNFLCVATHNLKHLDYSNIIVAKEVKPMSKSTDSEVNHIKNKIKEKLKLQKLQEQSASLEKVKQKLFIIKKTNEKREQIKNSKMFKTERSEKKIFVEQKSEKKMEMPIKIEQIQVHKKHETVLERRKQKKAFSLNVPITINKVNVEDYVPAKKIFNKKDPFVCGLTSEKQSTQQKNRQKIILYIDFLWRLNYSNSLFVKSTPQQQIFKAYVGPGNNSNMVKSILKRRFWWNLSDKPEGCQFVWTQLKQNGIFKDQEPSKTKKDNIYVFNINLFLSHLETTTKSVQQMEEKPLCKIFNAADNAIWTDHNSKNGKTQSPINERTYLKRGGLLSKKNVIMIQDASKLVMHNHLQQNFFIGNKKALFYHMKKYYELCGMNVFDCLPLTFHIIKGVDDVEYKRFLSEYSKFQDKKKGNQNQKNIWIIKPGEFSNRGNGISVCHSLDDILIRLKSREKSSDGNYRTFILQKYIEKPLLFKNRKFDIRHYILLTCFNGCIKGYWYPEGYIRTSSSQFTLKRGSNLYVHLTNDAIQKNSQEYGKYEKGNKISYQKFQVYLDKNVKSKNERGIFFSKILPEMKQMTKNAIKATYLNLDEKKRQHNFELLGMDFMIDQNYKLWLIQINTNPCLELSCPLLSRLIPSVVENAFKICVDPFFPPPEDWPTNKKNFLPDNTIQQNRFELIFDESIQGSQIERLYKGDYKLSNSIGKIQQDAQVYENDGLQQWQGQVPKKQE